MTAPPNTATVVTPPGRRAARGRPNFFDAIGVTTLVVMLLLVLAPMFTIVVSSLTDPDPSNFLDALASPMFRRSMLVTLRMGVVSTMIAVVISYPFALALIHSGTTVRLLLLAALMLNFWTSGVTRTYAWKLLMNNTGIINSALMELGLIDTPLPMVRTDFAVYVGVVDMMIPFTVLAIWAQMRLIRPELTQAAQVLGSSPSGVFFRITLPLSLPGAIAGAILVFSMALGFYVTPQMLGNGKDLYVPQVILQQMTARVDYGMASAQSLILLVAVLLVIFGLGRLVGVGRILGLDRTQR